MMLDATNSIQILEWGSDVRWPERKALAAVDANSGGVPVMTKDPDPKKFHLTPHVAITQELLDDATALQSAIRQLLAEHPQVMLSLTRRSDDQA